MADTPLISICLPVFNGEPHLALAIESVLAQSFQDYELLIADDGSTDASKEIANAYAAKDKRIQHWTNETRQGLFGNYNACINRSRGKYIKPYAQDDLLEPSALATLKEVLDEHDSVALVSSARKIIDENGVLLELKQPLPESRLLPGPELIRFHLIGLNNWVGEPSCVMYRAQRKGSGFDRSFYHYGDIEYWFRIIEKGNYYYLHEPLASFRRHGQNQTDTNHRQLLFALDILNLSLKYKNYLSSFENNELFKKRLVEKIALEFGHIEAAAEPSDLWFEYANEYLSLSDKKGADTHSSASEAAGFRLLSAAALSVVSDLICQLDHEKRCRKDEHELFVKEVEKMKQSLYWKLSNPLRKVRNIIKGSN